ncbi:transglutaminaseTgpA domain-containing protein [Deinococcus deserti]|uniref:Putative Transglutaminase/protease-like protein n=1 Tax=Deinococcus deserti (strain DSM 17065 / CIP 109153 / LMG 22923 / VCD115) TaxID=546414 RepID=C1CWN0_DEIDV|nr:transglutaminaseTgpA domain-containing protein [Deinococcus deserti]ACO46597.1 putative Transglutaminase/protease-like protein [Deinococcus deserti VCD115]
MTTGLSLRPTRFGLGFLLLVVLTLIGCVNYGLSLGYGLTFLLSGVWIMTAAPLNRVARGLTVHLDPPSHSVAGQTAPFVVRAHTSGPTGLLRIELRNGAAILAQATLRVPAGETARAVLYVPATTRGLLTLTSVPVAVLDPLGLWELRGALEVPEAVTVFPLPESGAPPAPLRQRAGSGEGRRRQPGQEDFSGLRPYLAGDSPRQISWRHAARTGQLLTRETDAPQGVARHLAWTDTAGETEARLSRMAAWVEALRAEGSPFSLELPGVHLPLGSGEAHALAAQTALAHYRPLPGQPVSAPRSPKPALPDGLALRATLLALGVALFPLVLRLPVWASGLTFALLAYAAVRTGRTLPPVPAWLLGLLAGLGGVALNAQYGTLLGRDGGTAILALLAALKSLETRSPRDGRLLALLGLFVTATHFFHDQGPLTALHALLSVAALLSAAALWVAPPPKTLTLRPALRLLALAAPVAVTLFVLFPRPDGPLWTLPLQGPAQTGLANQITAGEFSDLAQDDRVAFRADFQGAVPAPEHRYWRGPVFEAYDGVTWTQVRVPGPPPSVEPTGPVWTYSLTLEPNGSPWLLALDAPTRVPQGAVLTSSFQAATFRPSGTRRRYLLESRPARLGVSENRERLSFDLLLPEGQSPRARALAQSWQDFSPERRIEAALNYLRQGEFTYTLSPPTLPEVNRVDAFLFGSRTGFCEHYASSFAFLMRAAGLPARIVGGYLGGEINPDGGYMIVRQQDAHAWTEVWLPDRGWVRVDPTAVVAPARVNANLSTALTRPQATAAVEPGPAAQLRLRFDAVQNRWNDWVVGYDGAQQRDLLTRAGLGGVGSAPYLMVLPVLLALAFLPGLLVQRAQARPRDPAARALHDLGAKLGLPRAPGETITAYLERVADRHPDLREQLGEVRAAYHAARYAPGDPAAALLTLRTAVRRTRPGRRTGAGNGSR